MADFCFDLLNYFHIDRDKSDVNDAILKPGLCRANNIPFFLGAYSQEDENYDMSLNILKSKIKFEILKNL